MSTQILCFKAKARQNNVFYCKVQYNYNRKLLLRSSNLYMCVSMMFSHNSQLKSVICTNTHCKYLEYICNTVVKLSSMKHFST